MKNIPNAKVKAEIVTQPKTDAQVESGPETTEISARSTSQAVISRTNAMQYKMKCDFNASARSIYPRKRLIKFPSFLDESQGTK